MSEAEVGIQLNDLGPDRPESGDMNYNISTHRGGETRTCEILTGEIRCGSSIGGRSPDGFMDAVERSEWKRSGDTGVSAETGATENKWSSVKQYLTLKALTARAKQYEQGSDHLLDESIAYKITSESAPGYETFLRDREVSQGNLTAEVREYSLTSLPYKITFPMHNREEILELRRLSSRSHSIDFDSAKVSFRFDGSTQYAIPDMWFRRSTYDLSGLDYKQSHYWGLPSYFSWPDPNCHSNQKDWDCLWNLQHKESGERNVEAEFSARTQPTTHTQNIHSEHASVDPSKWLPNDLLLIEMRDIRQAVVIHKNGNFIRT